LNLQSYLLLYDSSVNRPSSDNRELENITTYLISETIIIFPHNCQSRTFPLSAGLSGLG